MSTFIFYFFFYAASRELQMAGDRCPLTIVLLRENEATQSRSIRVPEWVQRCLLGGQCKTATEQTRTRKRERGTRPEATLPGDPSIPSLERGRVVSERERGNEKTRSVTRDQRHWTLYKVSMLLARGLDAR
jgi:hypothetical protein